MGCSHIGRSSMKIAFALFAVISMVIVGAPAYAEASVDVCVAKYGNYVRQIDNVDRDCRTLMFPPSPESPAGFYQMAGNQVRDFALGCEAAYGAKNSNISDVAGACANFYFPTNTGGVEIRITPAESGGLY